MDTLHGIITPLITPITDNESPDLASLARLVTFQRRAGVHGLWAMGTSSEFAAFDPDQRQAAVSAVVEAAEGLPVIANISDAGTRLSIEHARRAERAGATAVAVTPPYYYPHSDPELESHFRAVRDAVGVPLFLYNIPQTVKTHLGLPLVYRLIEQGVVAGIKDSQNNLEWLRRLALFARRGAYPFSIFAGTRFLIDAAILAGADGAIPSMANSFPELCVDVYDAARRGDYERASDLESRIIEVEQLTEGLATASRNAAILALHKALLAQRGIIARRELTRPLRTPEAEVMDPIVREVEKIAGPLAPAAG